MFSKHSSLNIFFSINMRLCHGVMINELCFTLVSYETTFETLCFTNATLREVM